MNFINPAFLWALFTISIPIIIHLINFRRHKTLYFSNTIFLENIKRDTKHRTQLKHWLILLARILTIVMLVFAFAGPYIPNPKAKNTKVSEVKIVYVDNSFSMENEGIKGSLINQAIQIAKEIVLNSSTNMDFILITNSMKPEHQFIINKEEILRQLDKIELDPKTYSINEIISKANSIIQSDKKASLYIISDMQEIFFNSTVNAEPNNNIDLIFVPLKANTTANLYIDTCYFQSPIHKFNQEEELTVVLKNNSDNDFFEIPLKLYINDSLKSVGTFDIEANNSKEIILNYKNTIIGNVPGKIEITDYPITYDNELFFNYFSSKETKILSILGNNDNRYLNAILNDSQTGFINTVVKSGNEQTSTFFDYDLIVLNGISEISSGLSSLLKEFADLGGSVIYFVPSDFNLNSINKFLAEFNAGQFENQKFQNIQISYIEQNHEYLKNIFLKLEKNTDLPFVNESYKYNLFSNSSGIPLYKLSNNFPLLTATKSGQGNLFVFACPINEINSDFLKSPLFAPVIYNIAIKSRINADLYSIISSNSEYEIKGISQINEKDIFHISDEKTIDIIAPHKSYGKSIKLLIPDELKQAGIYKIINNDDTVAYISLNYNRLESKLKYKNEEELQKFIKDKLNDKGMIISSNFEDINSTLKEVSEGKKLWQYFLLFALFFIMAEIAIARLM